MRPHYLLRISYSCAPLSFYLMMGFLAGFTRRQNPVVFLETWPMATTNYGIPSKRGRLKLLESEKSIKTGFLSSWKDLKGQIYQKFIRKKLVFFAALWIIQLDFIPMFCLRCNRSDSCIWIFWYL